MRIFITGGTGAVGKAVVGQLAAAGHDLLVVARGRRKKVPGADYRQCDVGDYYRLVRLMKGRDAVVHLAALASPRYAPGREIFRVNGLGSFNVYEAAAANGIRRVVSASSINALGYRFGRKLMPIEHLPVDEEHPVLATDAYSFSKQVLERIADYFWNREGISGACLRLPAVIDRSRVDLSGRARRLEAHRRRLLELLGMAERARREEIARMDRGYERLGSMGLHEPAGKNVAAEQEALSPEDLLFMNYKTDFWAWVDELDSAQAFEKALTVQYAGCHALFISSNHNEVGLPVGELAKLFHPEVTDLRLEKPGDTALFSIRRARELIGFEPEHG